MSEKITIARIKKFGKNFEISVDPDKALQYKKGLIKDIDEVLLAERIFTDAKKGLASSQQDLQLAFKTIDFRSIADIILKQGEVQLTADFRSQEREQKLKKLIYLIHRQAIDPKTGFPHPESRIAAAIEEAKVHLDDHKTTEEQLNEVIAKIRAILPLKIEQKKLRISIPAEFTGKLYPIVKGSGKILQENWNNDGSWTARVEIPAGLYHDLLEKLNSMTHGKVSIEVE